MVGLLHELLDETAEARGDSPAVSGRGMCFGYTELRELSRRAAGTLARRGVGHGDRVLVTATPNDPRLAALVFGASRIGASVSILHDQVRGHVLDHILADCEPRVVVGRDTALADLFTDFPVDAVSVTEHDVALLVYTSGTTALPKAVVSAHNQVVFAARAIQSCLGYRSDDVVYCPLPLSFDYGLYQLFLGVLGGSHVVLGDGAEAGPSLVTNLERVGATVLPAVPPVAATLLRLLRRDPTRVPPLRLLTNTGAAMSHDVLAGLRDLLPALRVQLMFGLTECKRVAVMEPDEDLNRPDAVGRPLPGTEVFTVDDDGRRLPVGESGELVVRGPNVMSGYWRRPELTAQRFPVPGELHSGDYGRVDHDGYLHFQGRRDDVYKQQGFRVSAIEVEAAARRVPGVAAAAVLPPARDREHAVLFITGDVAVGDVLRLLTAELEDFKVPARCYRIGALPVNANGKTDKKVLEILLREGSDA